MPGNLIVLVGGMDENIIAKLSEAHYSSLSDEKLTSHERRAMVSVLLVADASMDDSNLLREIIVDTVYLAIDFCIKNKFSYTITVAMVAILEGEFSSLIQGRYDINMPDEEKIAQMKEIFTSYVSDMTIYCSVDK